MPAKAYLRWQRVLPTQVPASAHCRRCYVGNDICQHEHLLSAKSTRFGNTLCIGEISVQSLALNVDDAPKNHIIGVAASASPVSVSVVADEAVERIPTIVDNKQAGIDGAASLKPDSRAEPITLPTDEEFSDGLNQELILQVSPPKKKGRGRSKGVQKPVQAVVKGSVGPPSKGRGDKASSS
ncbi:hypothetical protein RHSIM_Rhsim05G0124300 [Rhododendron simsii]|uniref:Uncharacterized protein n=1 Tax=Rhododendron simsii TaxID=118357 RepID=A0A834LLH6_RHOSS|nr:hypothetical protein RHSIM_Rhsim05G0124300 [Rhododendron simsii]